MKYSLFILCFCILTVSFGQSGLTEENAKMYIDVFFDGFHKGDSTKMKSVMSPYMRVQNVYINQEGSHVTTYFSAADFIASVGRKPADQIWEEKLLDYKVSIDGNLAHVWTPYEFWLNGNFHHCGANSITLVSTDDGWKILNIIDSRRIASCRD